MEKQPMLLLLRYMVLYLCVVVRLSHAGDSESILPPVQLDPSRLSSVEKVFVKQFRLEGNTIFTEKDFEPLLAPYLNREITAEELQEVRNKVSLHYYNNGYINSGAVLPDQKIENGIITLKIIEGKLTQVTVSGNSWLRSGYVRKRVELATSGGRDPLNINILQERLKIIKQDPRIENVNATLEPGLDLGQSILKLEVEEARPYHLGFKFNNYNSPSIGAYRGEAWFQHSNLTGWGDSIYAQYGLTEGLDDYSVKYLIPITRWDTTLFIGTDRSKALVVTEQFQQLDIRSDTTSYGGGLRHPFYKSESKEFAMGLKCEKRHSETTLKDFSGQTTGFSFAGAGADRNGETDFTVWRFSQEWVARSIEQVVAAYSSFSFGDVDNDYDFADVDYHGGFFSWLGQFQWLRRLPMWNSQLLFSFNIQLTGDSLVAAEKFAIGGSGSVRGYRENQMTTDNGVNSSLEWRIPVWKLKIPYLSNHPQDGEFQFCPFANIGVGWNSEIPDPDPATLSSLGIGLRWLISSKISAEIFWGKALRTISYTGEYDIQDDGIHFQISAEIF